MEGGSDEKKVMRTFNWDGLPLEMKLKVLEKMSINSLCKFRRTSKQNEEFVRENRRYLRPEISVFRFLHITQRTGSDTITLHTLGSTEGLAWEDRCEFFGIKNVDTLNLDGVSSDSLRFEVIPFLKKLSVDGCRVKWLKLNYRDPRGIGAEDLDSIANVVNSEYVRFFCEFRVPADSKLPFIQQWQTNYDCQLKEMELWFSDESAAAPNALVNWVENDGRFRKVWDRQMHGHSILRELAVDKVDAELRGIYAIERNFEVDNRRGRNGILFVYARRMHFATCSVGMTVHDSLMNEWKYYWYDW